MSDLLYCRMLPYWFVWSGHCCSTTSKPNFCACCNCSASLVCMFEFLQDLVHVRIFSFVCVQDLSLRGWWGQSTDYAVPLHRQPALCAPGLSAAVDQELWHALLRALQVRVHHGDQTKATAQGKHHTPLRAAIIYRLLFISSSNWIQF